MLSYVSTCRGGGSFFGRSEKIIAAYMRRLHIILGSRQRLTFFRPRNYGFRGGFARIRAHIQKNSGKNQKIFEGASPFCRVSLAVYTAEHI